MKKTLTNEVIMTVVFIILGVLGVFVLDSSWRTWLLPIYTAIILLSYIARWQLILAAGILMPLISFLPEFGDDLWLENLMILVLGVTAAGIFIYFSYNKWNFNIHSSLVSGIFAGRLASALAAWLINIIFANGASVNIYNYTVNSITKDIKGIALQLALIPLIVLGLNKMFHVKRK